MVKKWVCNTCSREIESEVEPVKCPCGSKEIEAREKKSIVERIIHKYI